MKKAWLAAACASFALHCGGSPDGSAGAADPGQGSSAPSPSGDAGGAADASPAPSEPACSETTPRATPVTISVQPDEGEDAYLALLQSAQKSIRVLGYQMGYGGVLDTLKAKAQAGIDVRVVLDGESQLDVNQKYRTALEGAGAKVEWSDPAFSYMHAKVMIVDDARATVSTGNYSKSFIQKERNFVATIEEQQDVGDLAALFDADWERKTPNLACTRLLVSPVNARERLVRLVASAKKTLLVESMQLSDNQVRDAIVARKAAGVDVRVILAAPSWVDANQSIGQGLSAGGIAARWRATPGVHVKAIVVDGDRAYLGSENLSSTSLDKNREVGVVVMDATGVDRMASTFEKDWSDATAF